MKKTVSKLFTDICFQKANQDKKIPIWMMRQAGRYLPEYRSVRQNIDSFLDLCYTPELAMEVTLQPLRRFDLDAAILFSDILVVPDAMGRQVEFKPQIGPLLDPISDLKAIQDLQAGDEFLKKLTPVFEAIGLIKANLPKHVSFIGFSGAPWTLACYMIEGKGSRDFAYTKFWAYQNPEAFQMLIDQLTDAIIIYLKAQIEAGVEAVKLFESWAGALSHNLIGPFSVQPIQKIISAIQTEYPHIPVIIFPKGAGLHIQSYDRLGANVLAIDAATKPDWAAKHIQSVCQGNLDPMCLKAGGPELDTQVNLIKNSFADRPFIFNLGHGIDKDTPIAHVEQMIQIIRS